MIKLKNFLFHFFIIVVISFIVTAGIIITEKNKKALPVDALSNKSTNLVKQSKTLGQSKIYNIGDSISNNNLIYTINGIRFSSGNEYEKPKDGYIYYLIDITIQNISSELKSVNTASLFKLLDLSKKIYFNSAVFSGQKNCLDSDILPGKTLRGEITYEVPLTKTSLELNFESLTKDSQKFYYDMTNSK
jgi:hypothetical protein